MVIECNTYSVPSHIILIFIPPNSAIIAADVRPAGFPLVLNSRVRVATTLGDEGFYPRLR